MQGTWKSWNHMDIVRPSHPPRLVTSAHGPEARCGHLEEQNGVVDFKAMPGEERGIAGRHGAA